MTWILDKERPISPQLMEQLCARIANGILKPDERLWSVRELALNAGVNPNTVQKTYEMLEAKGLLYSVRNTGWFVADNITAAKAETERLLHAKTQRYFEELRLLGFSDREIIDYVKGWEE